MPENINEIFAKNLREYMTKQRINQLQLANALGVSSSIVTDWVKGRKYPRADKIQAMSDIFHCSMRDLMVQHTGDYDLQIVDLYNRLNPQQQKQLIAFARFQLSKDRL